MPVKTAAYAPESAEASHLRNLLERQPSCLLRVGRDGLLLACNAAGLNLLGQSELAQVLSRPFEQHLAPDHVAAWREFMERVWTIGAGSIECELATDPGPSGRWVLFQAVALQDHPDAIESLLITIRDMSPVRKLEESVQADIRSREELTRLQAALEQARAEHEQLAAALHAREAERDRADESRRQAEALLAIERAAAQRGSDSEERLAAAIDERDRLARELAHSHAEHERLVAELHEREAERARTTEEHRGELTRIQQLAEYHQLVALEQERNGRERVAAVELQLKAAAAENEQLARLLDEHRATIDQAQLIAEERSYRIAELEADLSRVRVEAQRLSEMVDALELQRRETADGLGRRDAELREMLDAARAEGSAQREQDERLIADLQQQLVQAIDAQQHATALAEDLDARLSQAAAEHDAARTMLERALADAREDARAAAEIAQADALAEARRLAAAAADRDAQRIEQLETELQHARADLDAARIELERSMEAIRDQSRAAAEAAERAVEQAREQAKALEARAADRIRDLEERVQHGEAAREAARIEMDRALADLANARAGAVAEAQRTGRLLADLEARLGQAETDHEATRTELMRAVVDAREHGARELERAVRETRNLEAALREALAERDKVRAEWEREVAAARDASRSEGEARLQQALEEARSAAAEQRDRDHRVLESLRAEHAAVLADRTRITELLDELSAELRRISAEHEAATAQLERTLAEARAEATRQHDRDRQALAAAEERYTQAAAERDRLLEAVAREQSERRRLEADQAVIRADIERKLVEDHDREMAVRDRQRAELVANLQSELALATADHKRLESLLARAEADRQRLVATHAAERGDAERALGEATLRRNEMAKQLADARVELKHWRDAACELEPIAAAGRLALQLSSELHDLVSAVDERSRILLDVSRLDASFRPIVETLRADAMRTAFLARRLSRLQRDPAADEESR